MSIAISLQLRPSRYLRFAQLASCMLISATGLVLALGWVGQLPGWQQPVLGGTCMLAALCWLLWRWRQQRQYRLDIDGEGQMRLAAAVTASPGMFEVAQIAQLLPGSTIWPGLMLLRLQTEDRKIHQLILLGDSADADSLRALAVAVRWIIRRSPGHQLR